MHSSLIDPYAEIKALQILEGALEHDDEQRGAWVDAVCGTDFDLAANVHELLAHEKKAAVVLATELTRFDLRGALALAPPRRVGPYVVKELIGGGGMGSVYRAERDDGLFEQTVAIKFLAPGLMTPALAAQFAHERQILARLKHPNIAQLFDGGVLADGTSYTVMELVDGEHIDQYAGSRDLSVEAILELFSQVCLAIRYAHQNLVIHCDIKPANILVTAAGFVKVLDFGIAQRLQRAIDVAADESNVAIALTPNFASPEQLEGLPPSTAVDVYALGVLLFMIATRQAPYDLTHAGKSQRIKLLAEVLPTAPSKAAMKWAQEKGSRFERSLRRQYSGDLDAIVVKAMSFASSGRYANAGELLDDIDRFRGHQPVVAHRDGVLYRAQKFVRRYRLAVGIASLAVLSIVAGLIVISSLYVRAERSRAEADTRFNEVRRLARFLLFDLNDDLIRLPGSVGVRRRVAGVSREYLQSLSSTPNAPDDLRMEIAVGYSRLGTLLGAPGQPNAGDAAGARRALQRAAELLAALEKTSGASKELWIELGHLQVTRATFALLVDADLDAAARQVEAAEQSFLRAQSLDVKNQEAELGLWNARLARMEILLWRGELDTVVMLARAELARTHPSSQTLATERAMLEAKTYTLLGDGLYYGKDVQGALHAYQSSLHVLLDLRDTAEEDQRLFSSLARAHWNIGGTLAELGDSRAAMGELDHAADLSRRQLTYGSDDGAQRLLMMVELQRAYLLSAIGHHPQAVEAAQANFDQRQQRLDEQPTDRGRQRDLAVAMRPLGDIYKEAGDEKSACSWYRHAEQAWLSLDRASSLSPSDRTDEFAQVQVKVGSCRFASP